MDGRHTQFADMANASIHHNSVVSIAILSEGRRTVSRRKIPERRRGTSRPRMRRIYPPRAPTSPVSPPASGHADGTATMEYTSYEAEKDPAPTCCRCSWPGGPGRVISFGLIYLLVERRIVIRCGPCAGGAMQIARGSFRAGHRRQARRDRHLAEGLEHCAPTCRAAGRAGLKNKAMQDQPMPLEVE